MSSEFFKKIEVMITSLIEMVKILKVGYMSKI